MAVNRYDGTRSWYAISTYSGYEDKVADSIKQRVGTIDFKNKIFDAVVPKEKQIEIKNGKRKIVDKKIFQGYVLVEMKLSDETWYIVRNTPGVTGFVGTGIKMNYDVGEVVSIVDGAFKGFEGSIAEIDASKGKLKVMVSMFGRDTAVELDALQVKKLQ